MCIYLMVYLMLSIIFILMLIFNNLPIIFTLIKVVVLTIFYPIIDYLCKRNTFKNDIYLWLFIMIPFLIYLLIVWGIAYDIRF